MPTAKESQSKEMTGKPMRRRSRLNWLTSALILIANLNNIINLKFDLNEDYPRLSKYKDTAFLGLMQAKIVLYIDTITLYVDKIIQIVGKKRPKNAPKTPNQPRAAAKNYENTLAAGGVGGRQ